MLGGLLSRKRLKDGAMRVLLVVAAMLSAGAMMGQPGSSTTRPSSGPTTRPRGSVNAPSPEQLMNSMLKPPGETGRVLVPLPDPPKIDAATGKTVAPNPPQPTLMREGSPILDRTGRLTKSADGQTSEFTFDADGKNMQDPPLIILPNLTLMSMENLVTSTSKDVKFRVSGTVTEYKGRNYILIDKATAVHDTTQQF
jgi:hypothetical protein